MRAGSLRFETRAAIVAIAAGAYFAVLFGLARVGGNPLTVVALVPMLAAALLFGMRGGLAVSFVVSVASILLLPTVGLALERGWPLRIVAALVVTGLVGRLRDLRVALRHEVQERARARARFEHLLDASPDAMIVVGASGTIRASNQQADRMFGYPRGELPGQGVEVLVPERHRAAHAKHRVHFIEIGTARSMGAGRDLHGVRKNGDEFPIEVSLSPIADDDGMVVVAAIRDVTDRKEREGELARAQRLETLGRLASGIAHDFNNLLTVITSFASFARDAISAKERPRSDLEEVLATAERARVLIDQLAVFARGATSEPKVIDVTELVRGAEPMLRRLVSDDIEIVLKMSEGDWRAKIDPIELERVLVNLVANAGDAMPRGGTLTIETAKVVVGLDEARRYGLATGGKYVALAVSDVGEGISEEVRGRLFEPFFTTKERRGTGLGLATSYGIVRNAGGCIIVRTERGQGSTFEVLLPRVTAPATEQQARARKHLSSVGGVETILVVEDDSSVRAACARAFERSGYSVLEAESGQQALDVATRYPGDIHVVLADVVMRPVSGTELAERLARIRPDAKVVYMSGYGDKASVRELKERVGTSFIAKPFLPEDVVRHVRAVLDGRVKVDAR